MVQQQRNSPMILKWILFGAGCLLAASCVGAVDNGVSVHGALKVAGTQLVDSKGVPVQLRGMSSHGLQWYPEYINMGAILTTKERGANLFRLAMYADSNHGGYNDGEIAKALNKKTLLLGVENVLAADMYVIIDWHILEDKNPLVTVDSAEEFFEEISLRYAGNRAVIYEICNEPNSGATWADISEYANRVIPIIRKNSPDSIILVGTPNYSGYVYEVVPAPLPYENIMYSFHYYTTFFPEIPSKRLDQVIAAGIPIFVSEWGLGGAAEKDATDAVAFIEYMRQKKLSWVNWSLCNKDEPFSAIKPEVTKLSGWDMNDLTVSGSIIFPALAESAPAEGNQ